MTRETSPYIVGDFWLDKRRDGRSPDVWQIAAVWIPESGKRSIIYRSTNCRTAELEAAKAVLDAHVASIKAQGPQDAGTAQVVPLMITYWREHGSTVINSDQAERSIKTFIGFLLQDRQSGARTVVTDMIPALFERFRKWRMGPHSCSVPWEGEAWIYSSEGVSGATVQRNINDIRASMNYAQDNLRIPLAPKIKDLPARYKSKPKDRILTLEEFGRIFWYARHNKDLFRFVTLQMATSVRPMAAAKFDPSIQFIETHGLIDTQPEHAPQTKKRNAIIPAIRPIRPVLRAWAQDRAQFVASRKTAWRIMRRTLDLSDDVQPKTIRYTIATWLYEMDWVPERQISEMLGHIEDSTEARGLARTSRIYAKFRPEKMGKVVKALTIIWMQVSREARAFSTDHILTTVGKGGKNVVALRSSGRVNLCKNQKLSRLQNGGRDRD